MWMRATRWAVAALIGSAMTTIGCARPTPVVEAEMREPVVADEVVHAFEDSLELRVLDRLELDNFLRDRDIRVEVFDGVVSLTGEVWTPLEKQRVADMLRLIPGVVDVENDLAIRPPAW